MKVVLLTTHVWESRRRAGFHWLATAYCEHGHTAVFTTVALSLLSYLKSDYRVKACNRYIAFNHMYPISDRLYGYRWRPLWHPFCWRSRLLNRLTTPLCQLYALQRMPGLDNAIAKADMVVFESNASLLLFDRVKLVNSRARCIYRVSDDLDVVRSHPAIRKAELRALPQFDKVSVPSTALLQKLEPNTTRIALEHHGIDKAAFDRAVVSPYTGEDGSNAIWVGISHFDHDFLRIASEARPDITFRIIGPIERRVQASNVVYYGEMRFEETIPYVKFADIGMANRTYTTGVKSLSDSLKIMQYSYCRLPIVAPYFIPSNRGNWFSYEPGSAGSINAALTAALRLDRSRFDTSDCRSWSELAIQIGAS